MLFIKKLWKAYRKHRCSKGFHVWKEETGNSTTTVLVTCKCCPATYIRLKHRAF